MKNCWWDVKNQIKQTNTLSSALYWFNPERQETIPTWLKKVNWALSINTKVFGLQWERTCLMVCYQKTVKLQRLARILNFCVSQVESKYFPEWITKALMCRLVCTLCSYTTKSGLKVRKLFSCLTLLSMKFPRLINVKMPTIVAF